MAEFEIDDGARMAPDAHELYRRFGFAEPDATYLERKGRNAEVFGARGELGGPEER